VPAERRTRVGVLVLLVLLLAPLTLGGSAAAADEPLEPDSLCALGQPGVIYGTAGNDRLNGTSGADQICGLGGTDTIDGRGGNDVLLGGPGGDSLTGSAGNDQLYGEDGNDVSPAATATTGSSEPKEQTR
jgi:RTX calcium-binding nonapeptide repeat (4 copies)